MCNHSHVVGDILVSLLVAVWFLKTAVWNNLVQKVFSKANYDSGYGSVVNVTLDPFAVLVASAQISLSWGGPPAQQLQDDRALVDNGATHAEAQRLS